jgi:hypothetical protein
VVRRCLCRNPGRSAVTFAEQVEAVRKACGTRFQGVAERTYRQSARRPVRDPRDPGMPIMPHDDESRIAPQAIRPGQHG